MTPLELFQRAHRHGYAIAAFNAVNLETAQAVVAAAEAERAPVILAVSQNAAKYGGLGDLAAVARALRDRAHVPVLLHFDHAESEQDVAVALKAGFDSVMMETPSGDTQTTWAGLRRVADRVHSAGALFEAECDVVAKGTRAGGPSHEISAVAAFVEATACDLVAVDLGTHHKGLTKTSRLDFERLHDLHRRIAVPLVLHGGSSAPREDLARAAREGVTKINVATELMSAFTSAVRRSLSDGGEYDARIYLAAGRTAMADVARDLVVAFGSGGKARDPS